MKRIFVLFFVLSLFLMPAKKSLSQGTDSLEIWEYRGSSTQFAMSISQVVHIEAAVATARMMQVKKNKYDFEIVMAGPAAKAIVEDPEQKKFIDEAEKMGVKMTVCGYALNKMGIPWEKVDRRVHVTPNAAIYMFELQDKGFNTLP